MLNVWNWRVEAKVFFTHYPMESNSHFFAKKAKKTFLLRICQHAQMVFIEWVLDSWIAKCTKTALGSARQIVYTYCSYLDGSISFPHFLITTSYPRPFPFFRPSPRSRGSIEGHLRSTAVERTYTPMWRHWSLNEWSNQLAASSINDSRAIIYVSEKSQVGVLLQENLGFSYCLSLLELSPLKPSEKRHIFYLLPHFPSGIEVNPLHW